MTMADAQAAVDAWVSQFEEGYFPPLANLARLVEEVGELARLLNDAKPPKPGEAREDLATEMGDILFVLIALANERGVDLDDALRRTIRKYETRDRDRWTVV